MNDLAKDVLVQLAAFASPPLAGGLVHDAMVGKVSWLWPALFAATWALGMLVLFRRQRELIDRIMRRQ